jgi:mycofactocin precursor peptide peptidase
VVSHSLADLTWPEVERRAPGTVLAIPIGATEQHGPHLPLSTDTHVAVALADGLAACRPRVLAAPAVPYGSSGEHAAFGGTLSIGQEAVELLFVELGRSASLSFERVLLICAHGGNHGPLRRAEERLRHEGRNVRAVFPMWSGDLHAGRLETSLMLALDGRVQLQHAQPGPTEQLDELLPDLVARGVRHVSANGVLGDPDGASRDEGLALLRDAIGQLANLVDAWDRVTLERNDSP